MAVRLYAFGHKARAGKDTAVNILAEELGNAQIVRFAAPIYEISELIQKLYSLSEIVDGICEYIIKPKVEEMTGLPADIINAWFVELHNTVTYRPWSWLLFPHYWWAFFKGARVANREYIGLPRTKSPRLLQYVGVSLRKYKTDIWVEIVRDAIVAAKGKNVLIPDLRFENEANMLRDRGFTLINISRADRPIDRDPNHVSETALDDYPFDLIINNDGNIDDFKEKLIRALVE